MRLAEIEVTNLRCIASAKFRIYNFTTLIGPNNTGKSTILRAIQILLNQDKPDVDEWHADHKDDPITITGRFTDILDDERNIPGIASLVHDAEIQLRVTATKSDRGSELTYAAYIPEETIAGWSESWKQLDPAIQEIAKAVNVDAAKWRTKAEKERVRQRLREIRPELVERGEPVWTDEGISINEALKQGMPQVEVVPAVRDAEDESQLTQKKNIFKDILSGGILPEVKTTPQYEAMVRQAEELSLRLSGKGGACLPTTEKICGEVTDVAKEVLDLAVLFRLDPPEIEKLIGAGARIRISDGTETPVSLQGHGAQRALIYALVRYIARFRATKEGHVRPVVLLFEEPELYVHPQLLRALKQSIKILSAKPGWQVVVTTHSPAMIDVADAPESLVIMQRDPGTKEVVVRQLNVDPFENDTNEPRERVLLRAALDFHPTTCEAFFAKFAVLVEGDSELAVLMHAKAALSQLNDGQYHRVEDVSIVSCGGKWTILPIARLMKAFGIPVRVIHDKDAKGLSNAELAAKPPIHPFNANARIAQIVGQESVYVVDDTLEDILFADGRQNSEKDKPFTAWSRMGQIVAGKELNKLPALAGLLRFAYGRQ
jgi:putative ATP-dependent endonuclease of the OLD family